MACYLVKLEYEEDSVPRVTPRFLCTSVRWLAGFGNLSSKD